MKIKLSIKRKKQIKKNFDISKPPKRINELKYWNTIKAGKARFANSFRDKNNAFLPFPEKFMKDFIIPLAAEKGVSVRNYLQQKSNKDEAKKIFKLRRLDYYFNDKTVNKFLENLPQKTAIYIYTGDAKYKATKTEIILYLVKTKQVFLELDRRVQFFRVSLVDGFERAMFWLPDLKKVQKLALKGEKPHG